MIERGWFTSVILVLAVVALGFLVLPVLGIGLNEPWPVAWSEVSSPAALDALRLSVLCSLSATAVALLLGLPLAWVLARTELPGLSVLRAVTLLPMVLPPVVGGVALLYAFGRRGLLGATLFDTFGIRLPFSTAGVILAEAFVAMPFLVITLEAGLRSADLGLEDAARTLGAGPWRRFRTVTLPLLRPALFAGCILCWARALGEFGATITFAGNLPGVTQTLPLAVYLNLETSPPAALTLSLLMVLISVGVLIALRDRWLRI